MCLTIFGENLYQRYVFITLISHTVFLLAVQTVVSILSSTKKEEVSISKFSYLLLTFVLSYIYLRDAFKTSNGVQLWSYMALLIYSLIQFTMDSSDILLHPSTISTLLLVQFYIYLSVHLVVIILQYLFFKRAIKEFVWNAFRITGADKDRQKLYRALQYFQVLLKITAIVVIPNFTLIFSLPKPTGSGAKRWELLMILTGCTMITLIACLGCGIIFSKRESRLGMLLYFLLLFHNLGFFIFLIIYGSLSALPLLTVIGGFHAIWFIFILLFSVRIVLNFGKGLLDSFGQQLQDDGKPIRRLELDAEE